jgi:acetoin utilization deacetylase AcuC-like enzyme
VIVCAGYDALASDPLASVCLTAQDYGRMVNRLCEHVSSFHNQPKIMLGLEGGYDVGEAGPSGNLPEAVVETIQSFLSQDYYYPRQEI